jgi:hypothetical protein
LVSGLRVAFSNDWYRVLAPKREAVANSNIISKMSVLLKEYDGATAESMNDGFQEV